MELEKFLYAYKTTSEKHGWGSIPLGNYLYGFQMNVWTKDGNARAIMASVDKEQLFKEIYERFLSNVSEVLSKHGIITDNEMMNYIMNVIRGQVKEGTSIEGYKDIIGIINKLTDEYSTCGYTHPLYRALTDNYKILSYLDDRTSVIASQIAENYSRMANPRQEGYALFQEKYNGEGHSK